MHSSCQQSEPRWLKVLLHLQAPIRMALEASDRIAASRAVGWRAMAGQLRSTRE